MQFPLMNVFSWVNLFILCASTVPWLHAAINLTMKDAQLRMNRQESWFRKKSVVRRKEDGTSITNASYLKTKLQYATPFIHSALFDNNLSVLSSNNAVLIHPLGYC